MKLGLISDIHGNSVALKACLAFLEKEEVGTIVCLGDTIGYIPLCEQVLDMINDKKAVCLKGNHEAMFLGELPLDPLKDRVYGLSMLRTVVSGFCMEQMARFVDKSELTVDGKRMLFMHGGPRDPINEYVYADYDMRRFEELPYDAVFVGHTHLPFIYRSRRISVMNVGSCGLPRDYGTLACCAMYDTESGHSSVVRVPFQAGDVIALCDGKIHPSVLSIFDRRNDFYGTVVG